MAAPILDNEFMEYWSKLSVVEKESLLQVAKNYVERKDTHTSIADSRRTLILQEREAYLPGKGKSYSWNEVREMAINPGKEMHYKIRIRVLQIIQPSSLFVVVPRG